MGTDLALSWVEKYEIAYGARWNRDTSHPYYIGLPQESNRRYGKSA